MKHALGVFAQSQQVEEAINQLKASGFPIDKISVIAPDIKEENRLGDVPKTDRIGNQQVNTTKPIGDTLAATTWGSLLVGLSSLALPGLGVVLAAGSVGVALLASLGGVAISAAATGNLVKALADLGIPEERARVYSDRLQQNHYLLILQGTDAEIHPAEKILRDRNIEYWGVYDAPQLQTS